jgi:hypothetical protein
MNLKISNPGTPPPEVESDRSVDPFYNDLLDWAKERKQQFLRNRARDNSVTPRSNDTDTTIQTETEVWIESWYTPPPLPSRIARQKAIISNTSSQGEGKDREAEVGEEAEKENCSKISSTNSPEAQNPESKRSTPPHPIPPPPQHSSGFTIGQKVILRPDAQRIPTSVPIDAALVVQEMYANAYRQDQNIWCIWCSSDAFFGLKSIDSDCLMPLPKKVYIPIPGSLSEIRLKDSHSDETANPSSLHSIVSYEFIEDEQRLAEALKPLQNCQVIAVDTETTGLDPLKDRIRLVQIAAANQPVIIIDLFKVAKEELTPLSELLQGKPIKVLQNAKFDLKFLQQAGLPIAGKLFDTMLAAQLLDAGVRS